MDNTTTVRGLTINAPLHTRLPRYVTPYLPEEAKRIIRSWQSEHNTPVLLLAMDRVNDLMCPNCGGGGKIYVKLTSHGPYQTPTTSKVVTWFDGNERFGKGWYIVEETFAFECPKCNGG